MVEVLLMTPHAMQTVVYHVANLLQWHPEIPETETRYVKTSLGLNINEYVLFLVCQEENWHVRIYSNSWREVNFYKNCQGLCRSKNELLIIRMCPESENI